MSILLSFITSLTMTQQEETMKACNLTQHYVYNIIILLLTTDAFHQHFYYNVIRVKCSNSISHSQIKSYTTFTSVAAKISFCHHFMQHVSKCTTLHISQPYYTSSILSNNISHKIVKLNTETTTNYQQ